EIAPEIPLIILSGTIGEEVAVECMKAGAIDYVLKDKLFCLGSVIKRALEETEERRKCKNTEEVLRKSEEKFRTLFEDSRDAIYLNTREGDFIDVNQAMLDIFGYTREEMVGMNAIKIYANPGERSNSLIEIDQKGFHKDYEIKFKKKDGREMNCLLTSTPRRADDGSILGYQGIIKDITELKLAKEVIQKSEEKYRFLADNSIDVIWQVDLKLAFTYVSPSVENMMGYTVDEWVGSRLSQHASTKEFFKMAKKALYAIKNYKEFKHINFNVVMLRKDGTEIPVEITAKLLLNKKGLPIGLQGTTREVTERKQAEEALRRAHENTKEILDKVPFSVIVIGKDRNIKWLNDSALKMAGVENADIILGKNCSEYLCPAQQNECPILDKGQQVDNSERIFRRKDGKEIPIIKTVNEVNFDNENVLLETFIDITERKQAEEEKEKLQVQLVQAQKMEAIGT
ncbi:MAG: PAS domain S-box protein, partial [Deltaproteobacteria bacterium]|nr:PAS domain S-box protein [Deltaproteobacteria bacterium]